MKFSTSWTNLAQGDQRSLKKSKDKLKDGCVKVVVMCSESKTDKYNSGNAVNSAMKEAKERLGRKKESNVKQG